MTSSFSQADVAMAPTQGRATALVEVLLAFAFVHVCWRSFKHFTWLGHIEGAAHQNYSAGLVMIAFSILAIRLRGWAVSDFGLNLRDWRYNLNLGIFWGVAAPLAVLVVVGLSGFRPRNYVRPGTPWPLALVGGVIAMASSLALIWMLRKRRRSLAAVPTPVGLLLLVVLWSLPVLGAVLRHRPVAPMVGTVGWMVIGAGVGEEVFFRGYIQTRLDLAFGKPLHCAGLRFGMGLVVSSILFGLVHALNSVDYFRGRYNFDWASGFFSCCVGVFHAVMRERTGSVFPGVVGHGIDDVLQRIPG